jgi:oligopeptide/dipeptide ABC transporter ATP-binding protein
MTASALRLSGLTKRFVIRSRMGAPPVVVHAVESVTMDIPSGTTLGIVGESGCGKSTLGRMVAGLWVATEGSLEIEGTRIAGPRDVGRSLRGRVQMVFQDPASALDPRMTIGASVAEPLWRLRGKEARRIAADMIERVGVSSALARRMPHELSGGQQQRVCIARALVAGHRVVVLDEVVSALDSIVKAQILDLLRDLQRERELTYLFISHDLYAVESISTHIAVMYLGELVEYAPREAIGQGALQHPYSVALLSARPQTSGKEPAGRIVLSGDVPSPLDRPSGCVFRTRCPIAQAICAERKPELREVAVGQRAACHFPGALH